MSTSQQLDKGECDQILREKIEKTLSEEPGFKADKVRKWCDTIVRESRNELAKLQKPYKLIVTCTINQRVGNGLYQYVASYSEPTRDVVTTIHWKNDHMHCIASVYALPVL